MITTIRKKINSFKKRRIQKGESNALYCLRLLSLHEEWQARFGSSHVGTHEGWSVKDTADVIGLPKSSIIERITVGKILREHPEQEKLLEFCGLRKFYRMRGAPKKKEGGFQ